MYLEFSVCSVGLPVLRKKCFSEQANNSGIHAQQAMVGEAGRKQKEPGHCCPGSMKTPKTLLTNLMKTTCCQSAV
jgi:hypothetical protein